MPMIVTSQTNPLGYLKTLAALVGTIATALLGVYAADTEIGKVFTIVAIIATAIATYSFPNAVVLPEGDENDVEDEDEPITYAESGGLPFPVDADESALYGDGADRGSNEDGDPHHY